MPKYKVKYVYERWYDLEIEAENEDEARRLFEAAEYQEEPRQIGGELQTDYLIKEMV